LEIQLSRGEGCDLGLNRHIFCVPIPSQDLDFQRHTCISLSFLCSGS
jgi:hypothetical protein